MKVYGVREPEARTTSGEGASAPPCYCHRLVHVSSGYVARTLRKDTACSPRPDDALPSESDNNPANDFPFVDHRGMLWAYALYVEATYVDTEPSSTAP